MSEKNEDRSHHPPSSKKEAPALLESLIVWCASAAEIKKVSQIDPGAPFFHIREEWGDRFILWEILSPWVRDLLGIDAFYPDELDARSTPRILAEYLAKRIQSPDKEAFSLKKYENIQDGWTSKRLKHIPGLNDDFAEYDGAEKVEEPTVFILTCPRSGSTLFRSMLAGHSHIQAPPELHLLQFDSMKSRERIIVAKKRQWMLAGLFQALEQQMGLSKDQSFQYVSQLTRRDLPIPKIYKHLHATNPKKFLLDKSPSMSRKLSWLRRAEQIFVNPLYLFITRHPCAVMESIVRTRMDPAEDMPTRRSQSAWSDAEGVWNTTNRNIINFLGEVPQQRWLQLSYEDLVRNPESEQGRVANFLDIPFEQAILCPYSGDRQIEGIGDPNISKRNRIDPGLADSWRSKPLPPPLSAETMNLAAKLGYELEESLGINS